MQCAAGCLAAAPSTGSLASEPKAHTFCATHLTRFNMSFWKQLPPKPTLAFRNLGPIRLSVPIHRATSWTSAPVDSHRAEIEFMELIR